MLVLFFSIRVYLLCSVVLVSAVWRSESAVWIHTSPRSFPTKPAPLGHHRAPSIKHQLPLAICFIRGSVYKSMLPS